MENQLLYRIILSTDKKGKKKISRNQCFGKDFPIERAQQKIN